MTLEFFSTLQPVRGSPTSITFRINNTSHTLSVEDLVELFGMRGTGLVNWAQEFDQVAIWRELTDRDDYKSKVSKMNEVKDINIVVFLKWFGHSFGGRNEYSKVAKSDLLALNAILHPEIDAYQVNPAYRLLKRLRAVPQELSKIGYGWFVRALTEKYNCMPTASTLVTFESTPARVININHLDVAGYVKRGRIIPYNRRVRLLTRAKREAAAQEERAEEEGGDVEGRVGRRAGKEPAETSQAGEAANISGFDQRFSELVEQTRTGWEQNRVGWETNQKLLEDIRREQHVGLTQLQWRQDRMRARLNRQEDFLRVTNVDGVKWRLTGYYGFPERDRRKDSWNMLVELSKQYSLPWCVIGDFNDLFARDEKRGGGIQPHWMINGFRKAILNSGLMDLGATGYRFTLERGRGSEAWVEERLDRALSNGDWANMFNRAVVQNLDISTSDHRPVFLILSGIEISKQKFKFRFENAWVRKENFKEKIVQVSNVLAGWSQSIRKNFTKEIAAKKNLIAQVQDMRDLVGRNNFKQYSKELHLLLEEEETVWKQRAKKFWLRDGDSNTKYFHSAASSRKWRNIILKLRDENGEWKTTDRDIFDIVRRYFIHLFTGSNLMEEEADFEVSLKVTAEQNVELLQEVSIEEVRKAVFSMHSDKSPGPDGLNPAFFKTYWNTVGDDLVFMCNQFLDTGTLEDGLNNTGITLIPKINNPEHVSDLRPIALYNVAYKILAKVLANRMKHLMPLIISENQSAFVENRLITDNFLVAYEIGQFLRRNRRGKIGNAALKIDMSKAYDRIEWSFVKFMMQKLGFNAKWIALIMECISSVCYTSVGDCYDDDPIKPSRGLRQGDPLSPYLFIICAEGLSCLLAREEERGRIHGVSVCRGAPAINHLFFADDCYLFFRASLEEARVVKAVLKSYEGLSGQKINLQKTNIMFGANVMSSLKKDVCDLLNVGEVADQGKYLGLPSLVGRNKRAVFSFIREKVWQKIKGWNSKALSRGGKEILLKTVAQAMPNFVMNVFLIPLDLCAELERMMNSFWWGRNSEAKKGICWASWDKLCKPKKFGGIGFRKIHDFNVAMLSRQAWRLLINGDSLMSRVFKAKYFPKTSFLGAKLGSNPSFVWRSIFATQKVMRRGVRVRIGDGKSTNIWQDPWLIDKSSGFILSDHRPNLNDSKVWQLFKEETREWDLEILRDLFVEEDQVRILSVPISVRNLKDSWIWVLDEKNRFSVRSVYRSLRGEFADDELQESPFCWNRLWNLNIPLHVRNFIWRLVSGYLPSVDALASKRVFINGQCQVCNSMNETASHIFYGCEVAISSWGVSKLHLAVNADWNCEKWCRSWLENLKMEDRELAAMICWHLWLNRNGAVWEGKCNSAENVVNAASQQLYSWQNARKKRVLFGERELASEDGKAIWSPPAVGFTKVNVDGAIFKSEGRAAMGCVVRNASGEIIQARQLSFVGLFDARSVELIGIRELLSWMKGWSNLIIESDALEVVQDIRNPELAKGDLLVEDCVLLAEQFSSLYFSFVRRSANLAAHLLARNARSLSGHWDWFSNFPEYLTSVTASIYPQ
ncbi:uncharacterized protein LOC126672755 [Mercurialis annua]|uniref:uncharacterized protein LOC126672755 n=1 Tax=Mercurialis annua TaxID=3986 RepID=UPI00215F248A|nr:uncharacterized protein LOC126672755 [Mercurialis annua]